MCDGPQRFGEGAQGGSIESPSSPGSGNAPSGVVQKGNSNPQSSPTGDFSTRVTLSGDGAIADLISLPDAIEWTLNHVTNVSALTTKRMQKLIG